MVGETTEGRVTYGQLWDDACRVSRFLGEHGVWPGEVVSVQLPNWYETVAIDLGVLAHGAVLNPLLPNYRAHELQHILGTARTKVLFTPDEYRDFDHASLGRELCDSIDTLDRHVVVRGRGGFWQQVLGRPAKHMMSSEPLVWITFTSSSPLLRLMAMSPVRSDESYSLIRVFLTIPLRVAKKRNAPSS